MSDFEKLMFMYEAVEGKLQTHTGCQMYEWFDDCYNCIGIELHKDGQLCWRLSKTDILFNYLTKDWK